MQAIYFDIKLSGDFLSKRTMTCNRVKCATFKWKACMSKKRKDLVFTFSDL